MMNDKRLIKTVKLSIINNLRSGLIYFFKFALLFYFIDLSNMSKILRVRRTRIINYQLLIVSADFSNILIIYNLQFIIILWRISDSNR
ncbi:hypothetical protein D0T51_08335 [Parabacteroides sp. 52]|nr:hypothetical protein [Parabacteroides sp. 52]